MGDRRRAHSAVTAPGLPVTRATQAGVDDQDQADRDRREEDRHCSAPFTCCLWPERMQTEFPTLDLQTEHRKTILHKILRRPISTDLHGSETQDVEIFNTVDRGKRALSTETLETKCLVMTLNNSPPLGPFV